MTARVPLYGFVLGAAACAASSSPPPPRARQIAPTSPFRARALLGVELDAGALDEPGVTFFATDGGAAVSAEAGVHGGELAWLVTHLADTPDRANASDGPSVRALAALGPDGVRVLAPVFRRADALRVPFARRVIERALLRACRPHGRDRAAPVVAWLERGVPDIGDAGLWPWLRADTLPWPADALARLGRWADAGLPCAPPDGADSGTPGAVTP